MKITYFFGAVAITLLTLTNCEQPKDAKEQKNSKKQEQKQNKPAPALKLKKVTFSKADKYTTYDLQALLPTGNDRAATAMRDTLMTELRYRMGTMLMGDWEAPSLPPIIDSIAPFANKSYKNFSEMVLYEQMEYGIDIHAPWQWTFSIDTVGSTPGYITFEARGYQYTGGAHGGIIGSGILTFNKENGQQLTDFFVDPNDTKLHSLLENGLAEYFSEFTNETVTPDMLGNYLLIPAEEVTLPAENLRPTAEGYLFNYQQYEVAPYVYCMPNFIIPYAKLKPFLTPEAKKLAKEWSKHKK